jgi:hypothetical protein
MSGMPGELSGPRPSIQEGSRLACDSVALFPAEFESRCPL